MIKPHPGYYFCLLPSLHFEGLAVAMQTLKTGSKLQSCTCKHNRPIQPIRPQRHVQLPHRLHKVLTRAQPDGKDPKQQQPEQPQEQPEKPSGTLSNRYEKMVEELQKAGLTPAKAKVSEVACVSSCDITPCCPT